MTQRQLGGDHLGESLDQMQLVGADTESQHMQAAGRSQRQGSKEEDPRAAGNHRVDGGQPTQRQRRGHEVDD